MVKLPDGTDPTSLAPLADAGLAAYRACRKAAPSLHPGSTVVVIGAGGLGHLGIQILRDLTPARMVAVHPRPDARALAADCGAQLTCAPEDLADAVGAGGAEAVLDFVGSDTTMHQGLNILGFGGHYLAVGVGGKFTAPVMDVVTGEMRIEGVYVGTYTELVELTELALDARVTPHVVTYRLEEADRALHDLAAGAFVGRAVLVP